MCRALRTTLCARHTLRPCVRQRHRIHQATLPRTDLSHFERVGTARGSEIQIQQAKHSAATGTDRAAQHTLKKWLFLFTTQLERHPRVTELDG